MSYAIFPSGPFETNAYVLFHPQTKQAVVIDPAPQSTPRVAAFLQENHLQLNEIWLTHSHWDHIADIAALQKIYPCSVAVHPLDAKNVEEPGSDGLPTLISIQGVKPKHLFKEGEILSLGPIKVEVIHTPGHTPGGVCFYLPNEKLLFSGDTLFQSSIGNLSFPTSQPGLMWKSLSRLSTLPPETKVFPGHGDSTTIGKEKWLSRAEEIFG